MSANAHTIASLADRLTNLANDYKSDIASVLEDAEKADVDPGALRRLVAWQRMDAIKRAEREALDEQYRFLAGELEQPATLPEEGELAQAVRFYADGLSIRQVAEVLKISVGKAHKLKTQAAAFTVHFEMNVNRQTPPVDAQRQEGLPVPAPDHGLAFASDIESTESQETTDGRQERADEKAADPANSEAEPADDSRTGRLLAGVPGRDGEGPCGVGDRTPPAERCAQEVGALDTRGKAHTNSDDLAIPDFLKRERGAKDNSSGAGAASFRSQPTGEVPQ